MSEFHFLELQVPGRPNRNPCARVLNRNEYNTLRTLMNAAKRTKP
jgi:hypothetical protein